MQLFFSLFLMLCFLFIPTKGHSYTYQDVQNYLNTYPAPQDCSNWLEEYTSGTKKGYKVWQRCPSSAMSTAKAWFEDGSYYPNPGHLAWYPLTCDGSANRVLTTGGFYFFSKQKEVVTFCDGRTYEYVATRGVSAVGISNPCLIEDIVRECIPQDSLLKDFYPVELCSDIDHDGYYAYNSSSCPQGNDCSDGDAAIYPGAPEICDGRDNNCDGQADEGCCVDNDHDGYYAYNAISCSQGNDCRDESGAVNPGAYEVCDGVDNNCDGNTDETCTGQSCNNGTDVGSSANFASGNLYHSQDLITGPKNNLAISYNSLDGNSGPLGTGWTHNYNVRIIENSDASIALIKGDGKRIYFWLSEGIYYPELRSGEYSTIQKNADGTYIQTPKDGTIHTFDQSGKLTAITDRNGNAVTLAYISGDLISITDSAGRTTTLDYNADHRIATINDPSGNIHSFTYAGNDLTNVTTTSDGQQTAPTVWTYTYDSSGRMLAKTNPQGYTTTYNYDDSGKLISSIDPEGRTKTLNYDQTNNTATVTEKDGGVWTYQYDNSLNVTLKKTDPENGTTSYTYDQNRNMASKTEPDGTITSYTYDTSGNMTSQTDSMGQTTTYTYNSYGQVTSITAPDGTTTTYEYDANGNVTKTTDATGASTSYQYDAKGNVIQIKDAVGQTTSFTYDQQNNLSSVTDPTGATTSFTYDTAGNMTSQTDASGNTTRFEYNSLGRLIKVIDPSGNSTNSTYDANGNKTSETDANGNTTYYEYNYKGQLIKVKDALGNITTYTYGGTGCSSCGGGTDKLTVITDANGNATKYEYDRLGRLTKETDPLGNAISYSYDSKGNLLSKTDANGATTSYSYDGLGRLLKKAYPDNTTESFTYDAKGNFLTATNSNISYTFTYSTNGKVTSVADSNSRVVSYQYNALGNKTKLVYPEGSTVTYSYDSANRLKSIVNGGGKTYTFTYDTAGRRTKLSLPNDTSANYSYDTIGRLTSLTHKTSSNSTIASFAYTHDNVGNRLTKTQSPSPLAGEGGVRGNADVKHTYNYDAIYRLTEALSSTPGYSSNTNGKGNGIATATQQQKEFYTYDPVGNRLSTDKDNSYTYNQANQLQTNGGIYSYDKNGNLTSKIEGTTVFSYYYDYENRLVKVVRVENSVMTTSEYKYDPFGRRIEKKVTESGTTTTTRFVYDNEDIILEYDGNGNLGNRYVHGPGIDEPLAVVNGKNTYYYHADGLGSIVALTDSTGKTQQTYEYDSFGNLKDQKNKVKQPYTFTGREWDKETGLYAYRVRSYDPKSGRFISKDPIGFAGGDTNLYAYVWNRPTMFIDPWGLFGITGPGFTNVRPDNPYTPPSNYTGPLPSNLNGMTPSGGNAIPGQFGLAGIAGAYSAGNAVRQGISPVIGAYRRGTLIPLFLNILPDPNIFNPRPANAETLPRCQ